MKIKKDPYILTLIGSIIYIIMSWINRFVTKIADIYFIPIGVICVLLMIVGVILKYRKNK